MRKLILWLDMYRISIVEYINKLKQNKIAYENTKNSPLKQAIDVYEEDPESFDITSIELNNGDNIEIFVGEYYRLDYTVLPEDYASQILKTDGESDVMLQKHGLDYYIVCYEVGTHTINITTINGEAAVTVTVIVKPKDS